MTDYISNHSSGTLIPVHSHSQSPTKEEKVKYDVTFDVTSFLNLPRYKIICQIVCGRPPSAVGPRPSYLKLISENRHLWQNTDVLQLEPFRTITQPMYWFMQLIFLVMAVCQLVEMISFSIFYMPSYCSLKQQLNPDISAQCNSSTVPPEPFEVSVSLLCAILNFLWLPWPTAICVGTAINRFPHRKWSQRAYGCFSARLVFAPLLWVWYFTTFIRSELYLSLTSLVHLFGWLVTLSFFISSLENASIFSFLLKDIVVKDIASSFGIVFVFVLVSFSSAIHLLRESALLGESSYFDTMYNVFAAALTTGEFMSETVEKPADVVARYHLLQAVFAIYLCCATIILLNILITMMNYRYEEARKKAQNIWRFQTVHSYLCVGFTQTKVLEHFRDYWRFACSTFWKQFANTAYDKVSIDTVKEGDKFFLRLNLKYTTPNNITAECH